MATYKGRVALVTGASSGIGAAIAEDLVKSGMIVVGAARRVERIQTYTDTIQGGLARVEAVESADVQWTFGQRKCGTRAKTAVLADRLKGQSGRLIPKKLDMSKDSEIEEIFRWIEKDLGGVDVLINNAAVLNAKPIHEQTTQEIKFLTDVNLVGVLLAAREAVKGFIRRNLDDGYIININSVAGHIIPFFPGLSLGIYPSSKHAMTATCEALRHDAKNAGRKLRVTSISPGAVKTEMNGGEFTADMAQNMLTAEEVAKTVTFALSMPKSAEITELTIQPTGEVF